MKAMLYIPEPCSENWNAMTPEKQGRHCTLCARTVTDFTGWAVADIGAYLKVHTGKHICGRFHSSQLLQPFNLKVLAPDVMRWKCPALHQIAAVIILCFATATTSCNDPSHNKAATEVRNPALQATKGAALTVATKDTSMPPSPPPPVKLQRAVSYGEGPYESSFTMGVPEFVDEPGIYRDSLPASTPVVPVSGAVQAFVVDTVSRITLPPGKQEAE